MQIATALDKSTENDVQATFSSHIINSNKIYTATSNCDQKKLLNKP